MWWPHVLLGLAVLIMVSAAVGGTEGIGTLFLIFFGLIALTVISVVVGVGTVFVIDVRSFHGHYPLAFMTSMSYVIGVICFMCVGTCFIPGIGVLLSLISVIGGTWVLIRAFTTQDAMSGVFTGCLIIGVGFFVCLIGLIIHCIRDKQGTREYKRYCRAQNVREQERDKREQKEILERAEKWRKEAPERAERREKMRLINV